MGKVTFISTFLLVLVAISAASTKANTIEEKQSAANHSRAHNIDDMTIRQNMSEKANHELEGKKEVRHKNVQNLRSEKVDLIEIRSRRVDTASRNLKKGLLVIPGLGREDRLQIVQSNIRVLVQSGILLHKSEKDKIQRKEMNGDNDITGIKDYNNLWDCVIYIYAEKPNIDAISNDGFWNKTLEMNYIKNFCSFVLNPGKLVSQNLQMVQPVTVQDSYEYIFILLDDCRLMPLKNSNDASSSSSSSSSGDSKISATSGNRQNNNDNNNNSNNSNYNISGHKHRRGAKYRNKESFDLLKILRIMKFNDLTVASPMVRENAIFSLSCFSIDCDIVDIILHTLAQHNMTSRRISYHNLIKLYVMYKCITR